MVGRPSHRIYSEISLQLSFTTAGGCSFKGIRQDPTTVEHFLMPSNYGETTQYPPHPERQEKHLYPPAQFNTTHPHLQFNTSSNSISTPEVAANVGGSWLRLRRGLGQEVQQRLREADQISLRDTRTGQGDARCGVVACHKVGQLAG